MTLDYNMVLHTIILPVCDVTSNISAGLLDCSNTVHVYIL